ncbi:pectin lyase fold/virulence factor [Emericellopsis atlantica]|uniref:Pectin lyase fold/virulence factor n=1 Tax=Emericellopsis atlantica TaxID=2614577 RepID=A0A9P8CKB1_9HYPO|nr:pectin lyase fold/virulence factor [Emericellopsis atlantica]KAG9249750.1 pectin lyase fold/virulence factor [Emericellopsis atlantica]
MSMELFQVLFSYPLGNTNSLLVSFSSLQACWPSAKPFPTLPPRENTCFVKPSSTGGRDDSGKILAAFEECNDGGTVVFDKEYNACSPLDRRFLKHGDVALTGTVEFCDDIEYWLPKTFEFPFQDGSSRWFWGGEDINLYGNGSGTIDGNGQALYDAQNVILSYVALLGLVRPQCKKNSTRKRPLLFVTGDWDGSITGLKMRQSSNVDSDMLITDFDIYSRSNPKNFAKNLDG